VEAARIPRCIAAVRAGLLAQSPTEDETKSETLGCQAAREAREPHSPLVCDSHTPPTGNETVTPDQKLDEISEDNLSFLLLAQRLIRTDREQAVYRLGVSEDIASLVDKLTPAQTMKIATSTTPLSLARDLSLVLRSFL
jgi:hypothetical protein